jgi:hypothetical protein
VERGDKPVADVMTIRRYNGNGWDPTTSHVFESPGFDVGVDGNPLFSHCDWHYIAAAFLGQRKVVGSCLSV